MWETSEELAWFYYVLKNNFWGPWFLYEPTYFTIWSHLSPCGPFQPPVWPKWRRHTWTLIGLGAQALTDQFHVLRVHLRRKARQLPSVVDRWFRPPRGKGKGFPVPGGYLRGQHARGVCWGGWKMVKIQGQLGFYPEFDVWVAKLNINHLRKVFIGHGNTSGNLVSFRF